MAREKGMDSLQLEKSGRWTMRVGIKGKVAFVDTQSRVAFTNIELAAGTLMEATGCNIVAGGSVMNYGRRLTERQDAEIAAYERTKADLEQAKETMSGNALISYWESQNDKLRNLGIRPLTLESLE